MSKKSEIECVVGKLVALGMKLEIKDIRKNLCECDRYFIDDLLRIL